jgi:DNA-binding response OmpR family regulator
MPFSTSRILVVEDSRTIQGMVRDVLAEGGLEPIVVGDGEGAWEHLQADPTGFEAVVLDRTLPGIDGLELLGRIKGSERLDDLPVILETARTAREDVVAGLEAGAFYYLTKPFEPTTLLAIVRAAVRDHRNLRDLRDQCREAYGAFALLQRGAFAFRDLDEARRLAALAAHSSRDPERLVVGLSELLVNAVEHGNLGITYEEKTRLLAEETWAGEVARRLGMPEHREKHGTLEIERRGPEIVFRIRDQGRGFDWRRYLTMSPDRAFDTHGRGIALSRQMSFDRLEYVGSGSEVVAVKREPSAA